MHWEYAAHAGTETVYSWGDELGKNKANCSGCGSQWDGTKTAPAGSFDPNDFELHDMHGNVWEWVHDWYAEYPEKPVQGPEGPDSGALRVSHGGSWSYSPRFMRSATRSGDHPDYRHDFIGFRLALGHELNPAE